MPTQILPAAATAATSADVVIMSACARWLSPLFLFCFGVGLCKCLQMVFWVCNRRNLSAAVRRVEQSHLSFIK